MNQTLEKVALVTGGARGIGRAIVDRLAVALPHLRPGAAVVNISSVNATLPPRDTDLTALFVKDTALGRIGRPDDIARAVRFLASGDAGFITGEVLTVSGGYRL